MDISHLLALFLRLIPDTPYLPRMLKGPFSEVVLVSGFCIKIPLYLSLFLEFLLALLVTLTKLILISSFTDIYGASLYVRHSFMLCEHSKAEDQVLPIQEIDSEQIKLL